MWESEGERVGEREYVYLKTYGDMQRNKRKEKSQTSEMKGPREILRIEKLTLIAVLLLLWLNTKTLCLGITPLKIQIPRDKVQLFTLGSPSSHLGCQGLHPFITGTGLTVGHWHLIIKIWETVWRRRNNESWSNRNNRCALRHSNSIFRWGKKSLR